MKRTKKQADAILAKAGLIKNHEARMILFMFGHSRQCMLNKARWYAITIYDKRRSGLCYAYTDTQKKRNHDLMVIAMKLAKVMRRSKSLPIPT